MYSLFYLLVHLSINCFIQFVRSPISFIRSFVRSFIHSCIVVVVAVRLGSQLSGQEGAASMTAFASDGAVPHPVQTFIHVLQQ